MSENPTIGLDYSHNNKLILEASSYSDFTHFLFNSGYKLGKIQAGFDSLKKIESYNVIILSSPKNKELQEEEIDILEEYVKNGGSLLIISSGGGDKVNRTNLNDLTNKFGFEIVPDEINDSMNYVNLQKRPLITKFTPHAITEQIKKCVFSSSCSIKVLDFIEDDVDIKIDEIALSGLNCWRKRYVPVDKKWIEWEDCPKIPLMITVDYYKGKVVAFGSLSMFSSLGKEYGFSAFDNDILIANILRYLTSGAISDGKVVTVNLNLELFYWAEGIIREQNWESMSDLINVSVKYFKDNFKDIISGIKKNREDKVKRRKAYEDAKKETPEDKILELVPTRKKEDLEDIMSALEDITGEKYEFSIEEEEEEKKENVDIHAMTVKELKEYCKKQEIELPANTKKAEIIEVIEGAMAEEEEIKELLHDELKKSKEKLVESLEEEIEKEMEAILEQAREEVEEEIETKIETDNAKKLDKEVEKRLGNDIAKVRGWIMKNAQNSVEKEIIRSTRENKELNATEIIEKVVGDTKKKMEEDRKERIKAIKEKEIEILKDNQDFLDGILSATDLFDSPILDKDEEDD